MNIEVRRVREVEAVLEAAPLFDVPPHPESVGRFLSDHRNHLLIAYLRSLAAGFARAVEREPGVLEVEELQLAPAAHGLGIGRRLLEELVRLAAERGCTLSEHVHVVEAART